MNVIRKIGLVLNCVAIGIALGAIAYFIETWPAEPEEWVPGAPCLCPSGLMCTCPDGACHQCGAGCTCKHCPGRLHRHVIVEQGPRSEDKVDLLGHLPPLKDLERFPTYTAALEQWQLWKAHREDLAQRPYLSALERERIELWLEETDRGIFYWDMLSDAAADWPCEEFRRTCLQRLRALIGCQAYGRGWRPALIPR